MGATNYDRCVNGGDRKISRLKNSADKCFKCEEKHMLLLQVSKMV